ncbi:helix-turn-helix transcriptional regulator [Mycobacterium sp. CBMA293]|uniref:helix-turn-helix domain-containing protein n=1 Tax=unclassified Mycolicibacterium TaxID=2636767 RepID=UPI001326C8F8|nr:MULTISPECIES: helix-turn-helix transcriptional regulator [unclassified Mycolicibacterium]MUL47244.1 helix-turn-helix transcriptional regulator [Mycolicibacterium sp. CBMA 360]MUL96257.1 helix-turn-helix transcriptional regulator [Mycolicibacterium sp. CBMA 230]MUM34606.1 helix-turn-helix transcriptional regulator [Mycolicibacterium sp. CBMA 361]MUL61355.1 helix-turn-helix transcriptional regulator [Mycolicibacterium sp. CBMA 335]MUL72090.1 helix-turn-helix transcriptional regulator [Mycolic
MDAAKDIRDFLMIRRGRLQPADVGLPVGNRRRVPGLRREEAAQLAGVSTEYYIKIERGNVAGVSDDVLHAVARALRLNADETVHFFDLARAASGTRSGLSVKRPAQPNIPEGVQALMDSMVNSPAVVINGSLDIVAANALGRALYAPVFERVTGVPNLARFIFFDASAAQVFPQWDAFADDAVGLLQAEAARSPHSPEITQIVGELATRSDDFRTRWAAHNVRAHRHGAKKFWSPQVGDIELTYNVFSVSAAPGLSLVGYTAAPNSPSAQAITILGSWIADESASTEVREGQREDAPGS